MHYAIHAVTYKLKPVAIIFISVYAYSYMVSVINVLNMASVVVLLWPIKLECMGMHAVIKIMYVEQNTSAYVHTHFGNCSY